jgi:hypothetical protein
VLAVTIILLVATNGITAIAVIGAATDARGAARHADVNTRKISGLAHSNHRLALKSLRQNKEIQKGRYDTALSNCRDQNHRHAKTIRLINPSNLEAVAVVNAAIPKRNCLHVALKVILSPPGPPIPDTKG